MEMTMFIGILRVVAYVVLGGLVIYFNYNTKLNKQVNELIDKAEDTFKDVTKSGGLKHEWVIDQLYNLIPAPFNLLFTRDMMSHVVQTAFDGMASYATKQLDKIVDKVTE